MKRLFILAALVGLATQAVAHQTTTLGRLETAWPDLAHPGGATLETHVHDGIQRMADNISSRYFEQTGVANSATVNLDHNLGTAFSQLEIALYTGVGASKVRVSDPVTAGWVFAAGSPVEDVLDVTAPGSGGPHTFSIELYSSMGQQSDIALKRVDIDGETATNASRITVPKASKATIDGLNAKQATLWYASDEDKLYVNDGTNNRAVGSGAGGSGEVNYLSEDDTNFETTAGTWFTYDDGAVADPVDGTGGSSSTLTFARTTTAGELLRGEGSGKLTHSAADGQGEGLSKDLTVQPADAGKILKLQSPYTFTGALGDVGVYMLCDLDGTPTYTAITAGTDGTDNNLVSPKTARGGTDFLGTFVAPDDTAALDCRVTYHVKTTSASAWTLIVDDVVVGPGSIAQGAVVSDWVDFTAGGIPTGWAGTVTYSRYRRNGSTIDLEFELACTGAITNFVWPIASYMPLGLTPNFSASLTKRQTAGTWYADDADGTSTADDKSGVTAFDPSGDLVPVAPGSDRVSATIPFTWASGDSITIRVTGLEVAEWAGKGVVNLIKEDNLTDGTAFTTISSLTTNIQAQGGHYARRGNRMLVNAAIEFSGVNTQGPVIPAVPGGFTIDTSKLFNGFTGATDKVAIGSWVVHDDSASVASYSGTVTLNVSGGGSVNLSYNNGADDIVDTATNDPIVIADGDTISWQFELPIVEWANQPSPLVGFAMVNSNSAGLVPVLDGTCDATRSICSGEFTATHNASGSSCASITTGGTGTFMRVGKMVTGGFSMTAFCSNDEDIQVELPIASAFVNSADAFGHCDGNSATFNAAEVGGPIQADTTDDELRFINRGTGSSPSSIAIFCFFGYVIK